MKKVYIIKTGNTFSNIKKEYGDFEDWILKYINEIDTEIIDILKDEELPLMENFKEVSKTKKLEEEKILSHVKEASQSNKIIEFFIEFIKNYSNK